MGYLFGLIPVVFFIALGVDYTRQTLQGEPDWFPAVINAVFASFAVAVVSLLLVEGIRGLTAA